jgi:hypothetical protein
VGALSAIAAATVARGRSQGLAHARSGPDALKLRGAQRPCAPVPRRRGGGGGRGGTLRGRRPCGCGAGEVFSFTAVPAPYPPVAKRVIVCAGPRGLRAKSSAASQRRVTVVVCCVSVHVLCTHVRHQVPNATTAVCAVLGNVRMRKGDWVLIFNTTYPAVRPPRRRAMATSSAFTLLRGTRCAQPAHPRSCSAACTAAFEPRGEPTRLAAHDAPP